MSKPQRATFDLTREPWICCERRDGTRVELGFEDVLVQACDLAGVQDESPLATAVIHRLLLAIVHRVVDGPSSLEGWEALWTQRRFDAGRVRAYFERWRHRFDLFDAERPFLQVPRLAEVLLRERDGKIPESVDARRLSLERSSYAGAVNLLEHGGDGEGATPAEAVRAMLGFLGFGPGGRILNDSGYPKACPLRAGAMVLARGDTLHETLVLNLLLPAPSVPASGPGDAPAWEQDAPAQRTKRAVRGWLDALTWQARRVELIHEVRAGALIVKEAITGAGVEPEGEWQEPMHGLLVRDPKRGAEAVRIDPDKSAWRDATALFRPARELHRRPAVCSQIGMLVEEDVLEHKNVFLLELYGLASSQAAIGMWRAERMPLPVRLLVDSGRLEVVQSALDLAEAVERALRGSVWLLARVALSSGDRSPDKKDVGALADRLGASPRYWAALGAGFEAFLREVAASEDAEPVLLAWKKATRDEARRALTGAAGQVGVSARAFQARAVAERHLASELAKVVPLPAPAPAAEGASP